MKADHPGNKVPKRTQSHSNCPKMGKMIQIEATRFESTNQNSLIMSVFAYFCSGITSAISIVKKWKEDVMNKREFKFYKVLITLIYLLLAALIVITFLL